MFNGVFILDLVHDFNFMVIACNLRNYDDITRGLMHV